MYTNSLRPAIPTLSAHLLQSSSNNNRHIVVPLELLDQHGIHTLVVRRRVGHPDSLHVEIDG